MNNIKPIICNTCKKEFLLSTVDIKETKVRNVKELSLVYFTCPECNQIYNIMVKDKKYDVLAEDLEKAKKRLRRNYGSNNENMARMLLDVVNRKQKRLANHIDVLKNKYKGTFTLMASENNHEDEIIYLP